MIIFYYIQVSPNDESLLPLNNNSNPTILTGQTSEK